MVEDFWDTLHEDLYINIDTLNTYGEYVDYIEFPGKNIRIRLIIRKNKSNPTDSIIKGLSIIGYPV